jgi:hypothetical protein
MPWTVIVSSLATGAVRRRRFTSYTAARQFADRYSPTGVKASTGIGFRVELTFARTKGRHL